MVHRVLLKCKDPKTSGDGKLMLGVGFMMNLSLLACMDYFCYMDKESVTENSNILDIYCLFPFNLTN
jgi:hypothetical protein